MTTKKQTSVPPVHQGDCLSWGDSFFLYLEREGQPLSIASISEFEGTITVKDCARFIESKLHLIPRYRQRVVFPPFNVGLPVWEFDRQFRCPQSHPPVKTEARYRRGVEGRLRKSAQHHPGPEPPAVGLHDLSRAEGRPHGYPRAGASLPGRRRCRGSPDERADGH